ncbi:MAG: hypothetical protein OHK0047_39590 [Leptolyngbyaceae cyanobacterium]
MPSNEMMPPDAENNQEQSYKIELSAEELDQVSGGLNLFFTAASFEENNMFSTSRSRRRSRQNSFRTQNIKTSGFQFFVTDASSADLQSLSDLFSSLKRIIGS